MRESCIHSLIAKKESREQRNAPIVINILDVYVLCIN